MDNGVVWIIAITIAFLFFMFGTFFGMQISTPVVEIPKNITLSGDHRYTDGHNTLQVCECDANTMMYTTMMGNSAYNSGDNGTTDDAWCKTLRSLRNTTP